jgi:hypothetical protein
MPGMSVSDRAGRMSVISSPDNIYEILYFPFKQSTISLIVLCLNGCERMKRVDRAPLIDLARIDADLSTAS